MTYCPDWIFDAVCAQVANEYLAQDFPIKILLKNILTVFRKNTQEYPLKILKLLLKR